MTELGLHERPLPGVFTHGVTFDNLNFWFWIKAGMGFTLGAGIVSVSAVMLWSLFWIGTLGALLGRAIR